MTIRFVAVVCALTLVAALGPAAMSGASGDGSRATVAKKKCKRGKVRRHGRCVKRTHRPPPPGPLHTGNYVDSQNRLTIDVDAKTLTYRFYQPCYLGDGTYVEGQNELDGSKSALPGTKVGTKLDLSGAYTTPRVGSVEPTTTVWHMKGKWVSTSRFDGTLQFTADIPSAEYSTGAHCDYPPTAIRLNG